MKSKFIFGILLSLLCGIVVAERLSAQEAQTFCSTGDPSSCDDSDPCTSDFCRRLQSDTVGGQGLGVCVHSPIDCPTEPAGCERFGDGSVDFQCCEAGFDLDADPQNFKCCEESVSQGGSPQACGAPVPPPPAETPPPNETPPPAPPPVPPPAEPQPEPAPEPSPAPAPPTGAEPTSPSGPVCGDGIVDIGEECDSGPACDVECHINLAAFPDCRIPAADLLTLKPFEIVDRYGFEEFERCARIGGGGGVGLDHFDPKDLPSNHGSSAGGCSLMR